MHIEFLVEDSSGARMVETLVPRIVGPMGEPHSWRIHPYKGIGRLPANLSSRSDPAKRILLAQLPKLLRAYGKTPGIDIVVVVVDNDNRDCRAFLNELKALQVQCQPAPTVLFRLAIEEMEAWYLGDRHALLLAYPKAKKSVLARYEQDSLCGTWELLADAVRPGGANAIRAAGWPLPGQVKHGWAERIAPHMNVADNVSPSFCRFRDGLRRVVS